MKVWDKEIEACWMCPYYDAPKNKNDTGWLCTADDHNLENGNNSVIHKGCPFNKSITTEVIRNFGFIITKDLEYEIHGQFLPEDSFHFYELNYDLDDNKLFIEEFYQSILLGRPIDKGKFDSITIFDGVINNPEELKFVLTRLNIIK